MGRHGSRILRTAPAFESVLNVLDCFLTRDTDIRPRESVGEIRSFPEDDCSVELGVEELEERASTVTAYWMKSSPSARPSVLQSWIRTHRACARSPSVGTPS
jgi:hypothetical protein